MKIKNGKFIACIEDYFDLIESVHVKLYHSNDFELIVREINEMEVFVHSEAIKRYVQGKYCTMCKSLCASKVIPDLEKLSLVSKSLKLLFKICNYHCVTLNFFKMDNNQIQGESSDPMRRTLTRSLSRV